MSEAIGCKYNTKNKGLVSIVAIGGVYDTRKKASASEQPNSQKKPYILPKCLVRADTYVLYCLVQYVRLIHDPWDE